MDRDDLLASCVHVSDDHRIVEYFFLAHDDRVWDLKILCHLELLRETIVSK